MQCLAAEILRHRDLVKDLVRRALESEAVATAVAGEYWRESHLAMTTSDGKIDEATPT